jgi:hypothetical protein
MASSSQLTKLQQAVLTRFFAHEASFFLTGGAALAAYIPDNAKLPGGVSATELRTFISSLVHRFRAAALPAVRR